MANIGINGFGRMGCLGIHVSWDKPEFNFVQVNEASGNTATSTHLLKFDSVQGTSPIDC